MNFYVVVMLLMVVICSVVGYFALTSTVAMAAIMFGGIGAALSISIIAAWNIKLADSMYPVMVRAYGERYDSLAVTDNTRARVVKDKKGYEWLETIRGKRFKMPGREYMVKGNCVFVDLFDTKEQQFPITIKMDNMAEIHKKIIPEEQRTFFADKVIPSIKEATKPPIDKWMQLVPIISVVTLCFILITGMLFVPEYWIKSEQYSQKFFSALEDKENQLKLFVSESPIVCNCPGSGKGEIEKPEPPPG